MTRIYALADVVLEADTDDPDVLWIAPVPDGPPARLDGVGPLIIDLLGDGPLSLDALLARMRELIPDMPSDADDTVRSFLESLTASGILQRQESA